MAKKLTSEEMATLKKHEATLSGGLAGFLETADAIMKIRDQELWRCTHASFREFVRDELNMSLTQMGDLLDMALLVKGAGR